jgi:CHAD domain-containing protein
MVDVLESDRSQRLLARLERWERQPAFTPLGQQPLADWLHEWHLPDSGRLFLHPGWQVSQPPSEELHELRKRIKGVRYALEHLVEALDAGGHGWITVLKRAQTLLGNLHDLQVLEGSLLERSGGGTLEGLRAELGRQRAEVWRDWQALAGRMLEPESRRALPRLQPPPFPF